MKDMDLKAPMLGPSRNGRGGGRLSRRSYSVKSLKKDFVLRLPDKLRSGDLDHESETFGLDHSTISSLTKGLCVCVCLVYQQNAGKEQKENGVCMYVYNLYIAQKRTYDRRNFTHCYLGKHENLFCLVLFVFYTFT